MPLPEKYEFLKRGRLVEVRAEALNERSYRKGGDGSSELQGYEGSWRRARVRGYTKTEQNDKRRWVIIQLAEPTAMYKEWAPLKANKEPPLPIGYNGHDTMLEDEDASPYPPAEYVVAPVDIRPWLPFSEASVWPQPDIKQLKVGQAVLYVDGLDAFSRWECWVRRVFEDGVWLWVKGPEPGMLPWASENHHVSCCKRTSPCWKATFGRDRPIFPLEHHLRWQRVYDLETAQWVRNDARAYFDPDWDTRGRINGHCPAAGRARQLTPAEADEERLRAAYTAVEAAIADGALPEDLQQFVPSFDIRTVISKAAMDEDSEMLTEMLKDPRFHQTFCEILLDSLRQDSPVGPAGMAVFQQIKVTFKQDAMALKEHLVHEYARAHLL